MADTPLRLLVLCTGNRCRSQMAHGWLAHLGGDKVEVRSAGTQPKGVHPLSIAIMKDAGVDISGHTSDHVDAYADEVFDVAITVCDNAREACPVFHNAKETIHHSFEDPDKPDLSDEELMPVFARIRDEIRDWSKNFLAARI